MKKLILLFLFAAIAVLSTKAQIGGGYDSAFNFGGGGSEVKTITKTANGDNYFVATIIGKAFFAGQEIDGGAYGSFPLTKTIFGKISSSGTQSLIKVLPQGGSGFAINQNGELYFITTGSIYIPTDYGNGVTNNTWGMYLVKLNNAGLGQFIKKIDTGSNVEYGNSGLAIANVQGMQFTPDGSLFTTIDANNATTPPAPGYVYPHRIIKYDSDCNEVWHNEFFSKVLLTGFSKPDQFVSNDGRVSFGISSNTNQFYFDGEEISSKMSNYINQAFSVVISLKPNGTKNFFIPNTAGGTGLTGVNPISGDLYINYSNGNVSVKPTNTPYTGLPNQYPTNIYDYYLFSGTLTFNNSGIYQGYKTLFFYDKLIATPTGFVGYEAGYANSPVDKGDYVFNSITPFGILSYYDASFNFLKALKTPKLDKFFVNGDKTIITGSFKTNINVGNTTLIPFSYDTNIDTRFPNYKTTKADIFIAQADINNIVPTPESTWLGVDNNWNNSANWSTGVVPDITTVVRFNSAVANMPTTGTTPTALRVIIDAGVTAQLPTDLIISNKLFLNGTLQINHTGTLAFKNYGSLGLEGSGNLIFNGTAPSSVSSLATLTGSKDISISTNENITSLVGTFKNITFTGTAATISGFLELTDKSETAIANYSNTNYFVGQLTRAINPSGTYNFPLKEQYGNYEPTTIKLNGLTGVNKLTVANVAAANNPDLKILNGTTTRHLGSNGSYSQTYYRITPDATPTGGTFDVTFQKSVFDNGVTDPDKYLVISRTDSNKPWAYNGTKQASTQVGGTTNNGVVTNATVTAGLSGLTQFGEFSIAINTTPIPTNTAVITSTWTGAASTEWANAGNWSANAIPDGLTAAIIPAGLTIYPAIYPSIPNAKSLTVNAGVTTLRLTHTLVLTNGLLNNGSIEVFEPVYGGRTFYGFNGSITGNGTIRFEANNGISRSSDSMGTNNIEVNVGNANDFNLSGKISGNINIKSGKITSFLDNQQFLEITNPNSTITIASTDQAIAAQKMLRAVNTSGTYKFPIGCYPNYNGRKYGEMEITNNTIAAATVYAVNLDGQPSLTVGIINGSDAISSFIDSGIWLVTPTTFSTTGTIDLTLKTSGFTNGRTDVNDYVLLRFDATGGWKVVSSATITQNAGLITVNANGIPPFASAAYFCIGIKATTTTWTGNGANTNWSTAANWSNGVPGATVKAIIPNSAKYPTNIPTSGTAAAAIEIASGSTVTLPSTFYTPVGIINNGTIKISGTPSSTFYGFGSGSTYSNISGSGKLVFDAGSPTTFDSYFIGITPYTLNSSIEVNNPSGLTLTRTTTFTGDVTLTNGIITVPDYTYFTMSNPNATITGSATAYIKGSLRRTVNASGTVNFPVGNTINSLSTYAPVSLTSNTLVGTTVITANFSSATVSGNPALTISGQSVNSLLSAGSWFIDPNTQYHYQRLLVHLEQLIFMC
jgi:hypothetical protein